MVNKTNIALIPMREGSQRIRHKNVNSFFGNPLFYYTIQQAKKAEFIDIYVSSDSMYYLKMVSQFDVKVIHRKFPTDALSPDIEWIQQAMLHIEKFYRRADYFTILRPTNPFRRSLTIMNACNELYRNPDFDSLKAYVPCRTHPYKIFEIKKYDNFRHEMKPVITEFPDAYTYPTAVFNHKKFGDQVGFLDICKWDNIEKHQNHFGSRILPFLADEIEAWDINTELDWFIAEKLFESGRVKLEK